MTELHLKLLHNEHQQDLEGYVVSLGVPSEDADLVVQNTWWRVWRYADTFNETRAFKPWLFGLARHEVGSYFRKANRHKRRNSVPTSSVPNAWMHRTVGINEDRILTRLSVHKILRKLPDTQRERVVRHFWGGETYLEIAKADGTHKGTIARCMFRARDNFRKEWGDAS